MSRDMHPRQARTQRLIAMAATALIAGAIFLPSVHAEGAFDELPLEMTPEIREQIDEQAVPEFLAETMFRRLQPQVEGIISSHNYALANPRITRVDGAVMRYWIDPSYNNPHGMSDARVLPDDSIQLPEYWALARATERPNHAYNPLFREQRDNIENEGVFYFARGLTGPRRGGFNPITVNEYYEWEKDREEDLLRALYIGANGSDEAVDAIIDGRFMDDERVIARVQEWEEEYDWNPYSNDDDNKRIKLLAYLEKTLDSEPEDPYLAGLSLYALENHSQEIMNSPQYKGVYVSTLKAEKSYENFYIINEKNRSIRPLQFPKK